MKKKSPPYAFIGAILLFFVALLALWHWKAVQDQRVADAATAEHARMQAALDAANQGKVTVQETPTNVRKVFYATQPVAAGEPISPAFYESKLTPNDLLPDAYSEGSDITGWFAIRSIEKGDPLTPRNIGKTMQTMSERIAPGMRLISLPIFNADSNDTGGFVVDGDKVDLLYSGGGTTLTALQNVLVAYVPGPTYKSQQTEGLKPAPAPKQDLAVSFQVTPEEAQALINLSQSSVGKFSMILRSKRDDSQVKIKPFVVSDYDGNLSKIQRVVDRSNERVAALAAEIKEKENNQGAQGNTNETTKPIPPSP